MTTYRTLNINIGVLGHVDSGKTSLVKCLSTKVSTASLDNNPQSKARGITLDLGFSAFDLEIPEDRKKEFKDFSTIQFTLVDCPGHASLIKTIIGGAQIIDMMILVIDVTKGIQTQTAECLVIGNILTDQMIIVLNKIDLLPIPTRSKTIEKVKEGLRKALRLTRFHNSVMVPVSACVGGGGLDCAIPRLLAPITKTTTTTNTTSITTTTLTTTRRNTAASTDNSTMEGLDNLISQIQSIVKAPSRSSEDSFYFSVDHCFSIKGQGTVLTGTILRGTVQVNDMIEIVTLGVTKKVKSMQMFRKPVSIAYQGDRLGICIGSGLDSKLIERGIIASPGSVPSFSKAIAKVEKIRYFKQDVKSRSKWHVTVGHHTAMAEILCFSKTFWEGEDLSLSKSDVKEFNWDESYEYEDELCPKKSKDKSKSQSPRVAVRKEWYCLLTFESPIQCPVDSIIIGSKLDIDAKANVCRIAFSGRLCSTLLSTSSATSSTITTSTTATNGGGGSSRAMELSSLKICKHKMKYGNIDRIVDSNYVIGNNMFTKETKWDVYIGMKVVNTSTKEVGVLESSFGKSGKFKIYFSSGHTSTKKDRVELAYHTYMFDSKKKMRQ